MSRECIAHLAEMPLHELRRLLTRQGLAPKLKDLNRQVFDLTSCGSFTPYISGWKEWVCVTVAQHVTPARIICACSVMMVRQL